MTGLVSEPAAVFPGSGLTELDHSSLVRFYLDYCNMVYMGLPLKYTQKLQMVQAAAAKADLGANRMTYVTPLLHELH